MRGALSSPENVALLGSLGTLHSLGDWGHSGTWVSWDTWVTSSSVLQCLLGGSLGSLFGTFAFKAFGAQGF